MRLFTIVLVSLLLIGCSSITVTRPTVETAAVADITSTAVALTQGGHELNPLGFWGTTAVKALYIFKFRDTLSEQERADTDRLAASVWTAAAANNVGQLIVPGGFGYVLGLAVFYLLYRI